MRKFGIYLMFFVIWLWILFLLDLVSIYVPLIGNFMQVVWIMYLMNYDDTPKSTTKPKIQPPNKPDLKQIRKKKLNKLWNKE